MKNYLTYIFAILAAVSFMLALQAAGNMGQFFLRLLFGLFFLSLSISTKKKGQSFSRKGSGR